MWSEKLKGKEAHEAWRLIYDLSRPLTMEQRNKLWTYWREIKQKEELKEIKERKQLLDTLF
jgi:hypothetical protein